MDNNDNDRDLIGFVTVTYVWPIVIMGIVIGLITAIASIVQFVQLAIGG